MRVAYLVPPIQKPSGWRNHACGFINAIREYVEPVLFVAENDYETAETLFPEDQLVTLPTIQKAFLRAGNISKLASSLGTIISRRYPKIDIVHSLETYPAGLIGSWLAAKLKRPHVLTAHGTYSILPYRSLLDRLAYKRVLRNTDALCPVSPNTADLIRKYFSDAVANVWIRPILNGNDYYKTVPRQEVMLRQPPAVPTILSVGAVKPRKGYHVSLQAFAWVKKVLPSARYWIVGNIDQKKYYRELRQFMTTHQLQDVEFLGKVSEERLKQCYREASVFLLAPQQVELNFEGFGLVYLEAGAFGLPVVGTRTGGVPSAIRDEETGFIVEPEDSEGLAEALQHLLTNSELARQMGLANRQWAETLTWERYAQEQYQVYQDILTS